jgi:hypothetical protein
MRQPVLVVVWVVGAELVVPVAGAEVVVWSVRLVVAVAGGELVVWVAGLVLVACVPVAEVGVAGVDDVVCGARLGVGWVTELAPGAGEAGIRKWLARWSFTRIGRG